MTNGAVGATASDLLAAYQKLVAALSVCFQLERVDGNSAVQNLTAAQLDLLYTCDVLQHRLTVALGALRLGDAPEVKTEDPDQGNDASGFGADPSICCIAMAQETRLFVEKLNALVTQPQQ